MNHLQDRKKVERIVRDLKAIKGVQGVYLFGSFSKGRATPLSDIDLCVVTDCIDKETRAEILSLGSDKVDISLFRDLPVFIQFRVLKEGQPLYEKNRAIINHIFALTLSRYQEFRPVLRRYYEKAYGIRLPIR